MTWKVGPGSSQSATVKSSTDTWDEHNPGSIHRILWDGEADDLLKELYNTFPEIIEGGFLPLSHPPRKRWDLHRYRHRCPATFINLDLEGFPPR